MGQPSLRNSGIGVEAVRELLHYDPGTGIFRWKLHRSSNKVAGQTAGSPQVSGHRRVSVLGHRCLTNVLAWFYMTGEWPEHEIDHKDGDPTNDRWSNLRSATKSQNCMNRGRRSDNISGYKGVTPMYSKWQARIVVNGERRSLGCFDSPELAAAAYRLAANKLHGEFARVE